MDIKQANKLLKEAIELIKSAAPITWTMSAPLYIDNAKKWEKKAMVLIRKYDERKRDGR